MAAAEIPTDDPVRSPALVDELGSIDGMIIAAWFRGGLFDGSNGDAVTAFFVEDNERKVRRRIRAIRRLGEGSPVDGPHSWDPPAVLRTLTAVDWRVIAALRADPTGPLSGVARRLGVTPKTLVRHRNALFESRAVGYSAGVNGEKCPSVSLAL